MALLGNMSVLHKSPAKYLTGTVGYGDRANWNKPGMMRSRGDLTLSTLWKYDAVPSGMMAGRAFFAPQTAGRIVTRAPFSIGASAVGAMGMPGSASASFAITATSIGGLIAGGVASCTITISGAAAIAGLAAGSASGAVTISGSAIAGATAWGVANGAFSVSGTSTAYGLGYMQASTVDNSVMTPLSITQAVWGGLAADYNAANTMGAKLNSAASGGVDYSALAAAVWANVSRTLTAGGAPTSAENADAVRTELAVELERLTKLAKLSAIDATLVVTPTSRTAGSVSQTIAEVGSTVTVTTL